MWSGKIGLLGFRFPCIFIFLFVPLSSLHHPTFVFLGFGAVIACNCDQNQIYFYTPKFLYFSWEEYLYIFPKNPYRGMGRLGIYIDRDAWGCLRKSYMGMGTAIICVWRVCFYFFYHHKIHLQSSDSYLTVNNYSSRKKITILSVCKKEISYQFWDDDRILQILF